MPSDAAVIFAALKPVFSKVSNRLVLRTATETLYSFSSKCPSPFPQHKGHPMDFGSIRLTKSYVSVHLMPIYMAPELTRTISPALKKHMQGKSCFNFKSTPEPPLIAELQSLASAGLKQWIAKNWA